MPCKGVIILLLLLIFLAGAALRLFAPPAFKTSGHDEILYMRFVAGAGCLLDLLLPEDRAADCNANDEDPLAETTASSHAVPLHPLRLLLGPDVLHDAKGEPGSLESQLAMP